METFALVARYGFLVALIIEAALIGRALYGLLRARALPPPSPVPLDGDAPAAAQE